ncbi:hypothetical protein [Rhodoferax sp.]|uniref:hypothetical protein n=1 Tax=Rhodoferax sp. TaxID=50421 RepID=UPI002ACD5F0C|nr:hypothetical protein [Rhodoferax sp.]MDZ7919376.1 hypothetical protein [Rhodoferax sp.]
MSSVPIEVTLTVFEKTELGHREIQSRELGLDPLTRRVLILIDGKRTYSELAILVPSSDLKERMQALHSKECIAATVVAPIASEAKAPMAKAANSATLTISDELAKLPPAETRTAKEADMARNFLMNTVNTVFEQNTRLTLMEAIFAARTTEQLRKVYPKWVETMKGSVIGTKRLPEFREKLFQVL